MLFMQPRNNASWGSGLVIAGMTVIGPKRQFAVVQRCVCYQGILLQKSEVAGPRIFRESAKRKAITDSYDLNRAAEVACEFNARR
jgi:hypothetical protein